MNELLGMRELDNLIREEADPYKQIFEEKGIGGLIRLF